MAIISRKKTQLLKLIILSPLTERILLIIHIVCVLFVGIYLPNLSQPSDYFLTTQVYKQNAASAFLNVSTLFELEDFLQNTIIDRVFTSGVTANMPITPLVIDIARYSTFYSCDPADTATVCQSDPGDLLDYLTSSQFECLNETYCSNYELNRTGAITGYLTTYTKTDGLFLLPNSSIDNKVVLQYFYDSGLFNISIAALQIQG